MAWFSRRSSTSSPPQPEVRPFGPAPQPEPPRGRYGPVVRITRFEAAPDELTWQLPVQGELHRLMPGPDRPDYSLMVLERPLLFYPAAAFDLGRVAPDRLVEDRKGRRMVEVHALVLTARYVGQQLHPGMTDLAVNVAYVIDQSLGRDASVDLGKIEYAGVGLLAEGRADSVLSVRQDSAPSSAAVEPAVEPAAEPAARAEPAGAADLVEAVGRDVAEALRRGIEERRGGAIERLTATVAVDSARRVSGLTGNADGSAPEPTPETFERINAALARLAELPGDRTVSALTVTVDGDAVSVDPAPGTP